MAYGFTARIAAKLPALVMHVGRAGKVCGQAGERNKPANCWKAYAFQQLTP